jgi:hypothetical protein
VKADQNGENKDEQVGNRDHVDWDLYAHEIEGAGVEGLGLGQNEPAGGCVALLALVAVVMGGLWGGLLGGQARVISLSSW